MDNRTRALMAAAGGAAEKIYVEEVFSTYLYTGNGSTQTITNGIDLAGEGGLVWRKNRNLTTGSTSHFLHDTVRSPQSGMPTSHRLSTDTTFGQFSDTDYITSWNSDGFSFGTGNSGLSGNGNTVVSWTFRKAAKFFDVVTWTGDGTIRQIAHSLGSVPGCIIVKRTDTSGFNWLVYHRSLGNSKYLVLETTDSEVSTSSIWNATTPTSTTFTVGNTGSTNASGGTYVAYLFAHDAGGFGDSGNDSVVKCGSYTGNGSTSGPTVTLGWEPQWLLIKASSRGGNWYIVDNMRGIASGGTDSLLFPNLTAAENTTNDDFSLSPTGFALTSAATGVNQSGQTYIYIAIRRGPMKTPTDATKVFYAVKNNDNFSGPINSDFAPDLGFDSQTSATSIKTFRTRLLGGNNFLTTNTANAESAPGFYRFDGDGGKAVVTGAYPALPIFRVLRRAPGFFDVVAYTGTGVSNRAISHNLTVAPQMIIAKCRSVSGDSWPVYHSSLASPSLSLNEVSANQPGNAPFFWGNDSTVIAPTSSVFTVGGAAAGTAINGSGSTYIAYLFATCPGVSKVGNYTGTGTTLSVDCGFTAGARLVLIKRTDSTGNWYIWDSARGIVSGNDPYLLLNSTAAEVTNTDYIDPLSSGFQISSTAPAEINANGGSYIFLAVA